MTAEERLKERGKATGYFVRYQLQAIQPSIAFGYSDDQHNALFADRCGYVKLTSADIDLIADLVVERLKAGDK